MNIFIYSAQKCLLTAGSISQMLNKNLAKLSIGKSDAVTFDLNGNFEKSRYFFDRDFCKNVTITDLYGDLLCYPTFVPTWNYPYKKLYEESLVYANYEYLVSVVSDLGVKLIVKGYGNEVTVNLPFLPKTVQVKQAGRDLILIDAVLGLHDIILISLPDLQVKFNDLCNDYEITDTLTVKNKIKGVFGYLKTRVYGYDGKVNLIKQNFERIGNLNALPNELIPYAFLEEVRLGVDYRRFLSDELLGSDKLLKEFFGQINFILPPFYKELPDTYAVVSDSGVKYAKFTVLDGKIADISLENYF